MNLYSEITKRIINMIEKKISYNINIEKPSTTKPVKQGGVLNYLGKQKTVNAPRHWRSSPKHPIAHLSYITKDEEKILIDLNLYGSLKGKPNRGPFGLPSLQGSGGGSGGDGGSSGGDSGGDSGQGDSGPGGSDDGSGHGGPGAGDSGPGGSDDGTGHGGPGPGDTGSVGPSNEGFGIGPDAATEAAQSAAQSISADNISTQAQADQEDAATAAAAEAAEESGLSKAMTAVKNYAMNPTTIGRAIGMATFGIPGAVVGSMIGSNIGRGVTGPSDDTQEASSVQSGPAQDSGGGGITTINQFAPLSNPTTGDNTADSIRTRLENLLVQRPTSYGIPAASQLSNYNLLDLVNLRR
jgi:hypothetical protein